MSFEFILSYMDIDDNLPTELIKNHFIRKANADEMTHINRELSLMRDSLHLDERYTTIYEQKIIGNEDEWHFEFLSEKDWKYYIIDYNDCERKNQEIHFLEKALILLKRSILLGFSIYRQNINSYSVSHRYSWKLLYSELEDHFSPPKLYQYSKADFSDISRIHQRIHNIENVFPTIEKALDDFYRIQHLGKLGLNEHLKILGYFSIIEMLIAHKPKLKESIDSISHQISTKYNLLFKKFERLIEFSAYFSGDSNRGETIWKKLYAYRSDLAHGNIVNFSKEYKILDKYNGKGYTIDKNPSLCINNFLEEVIKNTILIGLTDPVLLHDLKQC